MCLIRSAVELWVNDLLVTNSYGGRFDTGATEGVSAPLLYGLLRRKARSQWLDHHFPLIYGASIFHADRIIFD